MGMPAFGRGCFWVVSLGWGWIHPCDWLCSVEEVCDLAGISLWRLSVSCFGRFYGALPSLLGGRGGFCGFGSWGIFSFLLVWATGGWSSGAVTCLVLLVSGLFPGAVAWGWVLVLRGTCGGRVLRGPSCISIVLGLMHVMVVRSSGMYILRSFDGKCIVRPWR